MPADAERVRAIDENRPAPGAPAAVPADKPAEADVLWDAPGHSYYFNYQRYLAGKKLEAQTVESWAKLSAQDRKRLVGQGEAALRSRLEDLLARAKGEALSADDQEFIKAVWGDAVFGQIERLDTARHVLKDPKQVESVLKGLAEMVKNKGLALEWRDVFDGVMAKDGSPGVVRLPPVLPPGAKASFLDALASEAVQRPLETKLRFNNFLTGKGVPQEAIPGLLALYEVSLTAPEKERREMSHILPTVVKLLQDRPRGEGIWVDKKAKGVAGYAVPGDYDLPQGLAIVPSVADTHPVAAALVFAHELQHIYDMYAGRYYTIDSEMRGFKVETVMRSALVKAHPDKYKELSKSRDDGTRAWFTDLEAFSKALEKGEAEFHRSIAHDHHYNNFSEGYFQGRLPLRHAVDAGNPLSAAGALADLRALVGDHRARIQELEALHAAISAQLRASPSRDLEHELDMVERDLTAARHRLTSTEDRVNARQKEVSRMEKELKWLRAKDPAAGFDLRLQVDPDYFK